MDLEGRKWKEFFIYEIFHETKRGKRLKKEDHIIGMVPYVSSSSMNNGIDGFVGNTDKVRKFKNCLSLANSGSVGSCFYEPFEFVASDHITHLKGEYTANQYLFMASMLNRLSEKYNFNREINDERIGREKLLLPVDENDNPDYKFMEQYIQNILNIKKQEYLYYVKNRSQKIFSDCISNIKDIKWKAFKIKDLFDIYTGSDLIIGTIKKGNIPVVSHSAENNGIVAYSDIIKDRRIFSYKKTISLADRGNFKAFIQKEDFYIGTRVKALVIKAEVSYETLLFISSSIDKQYVKFSYGHNACDNLESLKILLPENGKGNPDFDYMEQYIKNLMIKKYRDYISYIEK